MLHGMIRTLLLVSALAWLVSPARADARPALRESAVAKALSTAEPATLAKAPKKAKKVLDKAAEKPVAIPGSARSDRAVGSPEAPAARAGRGMSRIEFDDRLVQGQTNKANAIYLFERRESALRSLLKKRSDFHAEIDETLE